MPEYEELTGKDREIMILVTIRAESMYSASEIVKDVKELVDKYLPYEVVSCGMVVPLPEKKD